MENKLTDEWVLGFFEGEGCLSQAKSKRGKYYPNVQITQKELYILEKIQRHFGYGSIHLSKAGIYSWQLGGYKNCRKFYDFIKDKLETKGKKAQLQRWVERFPKLKEIA